MRGPNFILLWRIGEGKKPDSISGNCPQSSSHCTAYVGHVDALSGEVLSEHVSQEFSSVMPPDRRGSPLPKKTPQGNQAAHQGAPWWERCIQSLCIATHTGRAAMMMLGSLCCCIVVALCSLREWHRLQNCSNDAITISCQWSNEVWSSTSQLWDKPCFVWFTSSQVISWWWYYV